MLYYYNMMGIGLIFSVIDHLFWVFWCCTSY